MGERGPEDKKAVLRSIGLDEESISEAGKAMVSFRLLEDALELVVRPPCHFVALKSILFPLDQKSCPQRTSHCDAWLAAKKAGASLTAQDHNNAGVSCAWNADENWRADAQKRLQAARNHPGFDQLEASEQETIRSNLEYAKSGTPPIWMRRLAADAYRLLGDDLRKDLEAGAIPGLRFEP